MSNPHPSASWKPGQRPEGAGRQIGSRNRRTTEIVNKLIQLGHKDPLETLSELQHSSQDEAIRATAANMLAPFLHSKMSALPAPVYINAEVTILIHEDPQDLSEVRANKARIAALLAQGILDLASADKLLAVQNSIAADMIDETKLLAAAGGPAEQTIFIEGGLPALARAPDDPWPGVTMPPTRMNGKDAIAPDPPAQSPEAQVPDPPPGSTEPPPSSEVP
jgi:hypothetical protein